jgi:excisionase family DNA binding protein
MLRRDGGFRRSLLIDDAAILLGVSRRTVYYRIRQGRLETFKTVGGSQRVLLASIEQLLRRERGLPLTAQEWVETAEPS